MKRVTFVILILLLLAIPIGTAFAEPLFDTTVEENETVNNDVIVFDGDLTLESGSTVNGDVVVFNGDVDTAGTINGDLVIFNGDLDAEGDAVVNGDCVLLNGDVDDNSTRGISCTNIEGGVISGWMQEIPPVVVDPKAVPDMPDIPAVPDAPDVPAVPVVPNMPEITRYQEHSNKGLDFVGVIANTLLFGFLGFIAASLFPKHLQQVKATTQSKPFASGAVGVLTGIAVPALVALLVAISIPLSLICIGLLGFPIALLIMLGLLVGGVMGWIAIGTWVGERLFRNGERSLAFKAALGTMVMSFVLGLLGILLPFIGGTLAFFAGAVGLGAVALTQFGRKPYPTVDEIVSDFTEDEVKIANVLDTLPDDDLPVKGQ